MHAFMYVCHTCKRTHVEVHAHTFPYTFTYVDIRSHIRLRTFTYVFTYLHSNRPPKTPPTQMSVMGLRAKRAGELVTFEEMHVPCCDEH